MKDLGKARAAPDDKGVAARPDGFEADGSQRGEAAEANAREHEFMWRDQGAITSNHGVPLNIPTGAKEKAHGAQQDAPAKHQTGGPDGAQGYHCSMRPAEGRLTSNRKGHVCSFPGNKQEP